MAGFVGLGAAVEVLIYKDGQTISRENFSPFFNSISKVSAKVQVEMMTEITIELTPSFNDALAIMAKGILGTSTGPVGQGFDASGSTKNAVQPTSLTTPSLPSSAVAVQSGKSNAPYYAVRFYYPGEEDSDTDWYAGLAMVPQIQLNSGEITITIHITGTHVFMAMNQGPKIYKNQSALDVITKLAATFQCTIAFQPGDSETEAILAKSLVNGQYNENSESIIRRICMRLRLKCIKDSGGDPPGSRYLISSVKQVHDKEIEYTLVALRQVEPESNVIALHSFELTSTGTLFYPGHTFGSFSTAVLSSTKKVKTKATSSSSFDAISTSDVKGEAGVYPLDTGDGSEKGGSTGKSDDSDPDESGAFQPAVGNKEFDTTELLEARSEIARSESMMKFRVAAEGIPFIQPLTMVQLKIGPGDNGIEAFSGPCAVNSVEHTWDSAGWVTTLELTKTGGVVSVPIKNKASETPKPADKRVTKKPTAIK